MDQILVMHAMRKFFGYEGGEDKLVGIENNLVPQFDILISSSNYGTK